MRLALAGDTMLGRGVAERLSEVPPDVLVADEVVAAAREADLFLLNLECCISDRGNPWPAPGKPFFFRAPPAAAGLLAHLGVDCVNLGNNHALDFGEEALLDTFRHLDDAGIRWVGAGPDRERARAPAVLEASGLRLAVVGVTDHPEDFAAGPAHPGVAYADLRSGVPDWVADSVRGADADVVVVTPHWGPNMTAEPVPHVRDAATVLMDAGATLVAGHSAHAFHGVTERVLFDLGDFLDDYAVDPVLRNDLGCLFIVDLEPTGARRVDVIPLKLEYCHTRTATDEDRLWIERRLRRACARFGTSVVSEGPRLVLWPGRVDPREAGRNMGMERDPSDPPVDPEADPSKEADQADPSSPGPGDSEAGPPEPPEEEEP